MNSTIQSKAAYLFAAAVLLCLPATALAQMQTGSASLGKLPPADCGESCQEWEYVWQYFDFSEGKTFSAEELETYAPDIKGSSNEGINFGQEFDSNIPQYRLLLLEGVSFDEEITVPEWNAGTPWVSTSWEATGFQPIEIGQIWAVYTQEGHYAIMQITDLPDGVWGTSFTFDYKYLNDGSRIFAPSSSPSSPENLTLEVDQYFDFSEGKAFSANDLETYSPDIKGSSNEGINFGQEFDSNIPQYRLLLLEGVSFDEEITVPEWNAGTPWVSTSWEATGFQPIEIGQIWAVYTQEGHYAIMQITDLPDGVWGSTFAFNYKYQSDGNRVFEGTAGESEEEDPVFYLNIYSGNGQTTEINTFVPETLKVRVTDANEDPVSGLSVAFAFTGYPEGASSYGNLNELSMTDGDGIAFSDAKLGDAAGQYVVTATLQEDVTKSVDFILTATKSQTEYKISLASGNYQKLETGTPTEPLQVLVTDQHDIPLFGETVQFALHFAPLDATGMHFTNQQTETNANGISSTIFTTGDVAGEYIVKASLASDPDKSVYFTIIASAATPDYILTRESTDNQLVSVNSKLSGNLLFRLKDANGNPAGNKQINFAFHSVPDGAEGYGDMPLSMITGDEGYAFVSPRVGNLPGEYVIRASMDSDPNVFVDITLIADIITLQIVNGNNQMALAGTELSSPLEVAVKRTNGDFISGKTIKFEEFQIPEGAESGSFKTIDGITINQVYIFENTAAIKYTVGSKPGEYIIKAADVNSEYEPVYFNVFSYGVNDPDQFTATAGAGMITLDWTAASGAASYTIYRSNNGNDFQSAFLLTYTSATTYTDTNVAPGQEYYYWIKSVDALGNVSTNNSAPVHATPGEITEPEYGTGMIIATGGSDFSKTWQYFDFSAGVASDNANGDNFVADIRGTSNEGVNFGNENAATIEGRRLLYLGTGTLENFASMSTWTNETPWIFNTWDFSFGTGGQPLSEGSVWGIYTSEAHYAIMEVTSVPAAHGDTLAFRYKYQPSGSPVFGHQQTIAKPDSIIIISGNNQTAAPGKALSEPIKVKVIDAEGNGVAGQEVFFNFAEVPVTAEGYSLSSDSVITDFEGFAQTLVTLGSKTGTYTIIAEAGGFPAKVTFTSIAETLPAPAAVTLLEIKQFRSNALVMIWSQSKAANFSHYQVYMSTDNENFTLAGSTHKSNKADTSISLAELESLTEYFFKVAVVGADEQISEYSNVLSGIPYPEPAAPAKIAITVGDGTIQLEWEPQTDEHLEYYYVMAGLDGHPITPRDTVWNLEKPLSLIRNLTNEETYQFYVIAVNKFGMQNASSKIMAIPKAAYTERQSTVASLIMGGLLAADIDNDGDNDLFVTGVPAIGEAPAAYLYLNDGKGEFIDSGQIFEGAAHPSLYFLDIDFNGFLDLILIGQGAASPVTKIYLNQDGKFTDSGISLPLLTDSQLSPADYDNDGDMDLLITGESIAFGLHTILAKNNGGKFEFPDTPLIGLKKASASWADYNGDGTNDLLMAGENSDGEAVSIIYANNGDDTFTPATVGLQGVLNGEASWLDFNMDGKPDVLLSGYTSPEQTEFYVGLYLNTGNTFDLFYSSTSAAGSAKTDAHITRSKATIGDYDNDGDPDALISALLGSKASATILKNNGDSVEENELPIEGNATAMWADIDGDGDLDIIITGLSGDGTPATKFLDNTTDIKNTPPTVPSEFVTTVSADSVTLAWAASTDAQSPVFALTYNVRIGTMAGKSDILSANADPGTGKLKVLVPGNAGNKTSMMLRNLTNGTYYWQVQAVDNGFMASAFGVEQSFVVSNSTVSNEGQAELPLRFALQQNYPNPFNPATVITFSLPHADEVVLEVFDITGRLAATLLNGHTPAGHHSVQFDARNMASGIYIYRLRTKSGNAMSKKLTLIK